MRALKASIQTAATKVTDIGDILSGGSGYSNPANQWKDLRKKTGEIEYEIVKKEEIPEKLKEEMQIRTDKILKISKKALCG